MRIAVLGPGAVGGFVAAALSRAGEDVLIVARESTARAIARHGISVTSVLLGDFTVHPGATARLDVQSDVLLVATKATGLRQALELIAVVPRLVIPLMNGIEHMALLRARFGADRVAAGVIRIDSYRPETGRIVQSSPTVRIDLASDQPAVRIDLASDQPAVRIDLASDQNPRSEALSVLGGVLERAGLPVRLSDSEIQILWSKLVRLNALACTTSAAGRTIGFIRSDPAWREALEACVRETAAVGTAEGAAIDADAHLAELLHAHADLTSSMSRDIESGRESELDSIAGAVLRAAQRHGLACPTVARLSEQIAARAEIPAPAF